jgi:hypothetical protein
MPVHALVCASECKWTKLLQCASYTHATLLHQGVHLASFACMHLQHIYTDASPQCTCKYGLRTRHPRVAYSPECQIDVITWMCTLSTRFLVHRQTRYSWISEQGSARAYIHHTYTHLNICVQGSARAYMHTCIHTLTYACKAVHVHTCIHVYTP